MVTRLKAKAKKGKLRFKLPPFNASQTGRHLDNHELYLCLCPARWLHLFTSPCTQSQHQNLPQVQILWTQKPIFPLFFFLYFNPTWPRSSTLESDQSLHKFWFFFKNNVSRKSSFILTRAMNLFPADNHNVESSALLLHLWIFCI